MAKGVKQNLFQRTQVNRTLEYLRIKDRQRYLRELRGLLADPLIRFHIKAAVLLWMRELSDPSREEWEILHDLSTTELKNHLQDAIRGSPSWFRLLQTLGTWTTWLNSTNDNEVRFAAWLLSQSDLTKAEPGSVAAMLVPFAGKDEKWDQRIAQVLRFAPLSQSEGLQGLFLGLIERGRFDPHENSRPGDLAWDFMHSQIGGNPGFTLCFLNCWLKRRLHIATEQDIPNVFDHEIGGDSAPHDLEQALQLIATHDSEGLATFGLDYIAQTSLKAAYVTEREIHSDRSWGSALRVCRDRGLSSLLLRYVADALRTLAKTSPSKLEALLKPHLDTQLETVIFLVSYAWSGNPELFAGPFFSFVTTDSRRINPADLALCSRWSRNPQTSWALFATQVENKTVQAFAEAVRLSLDLLEGDADDKGRFRYHILKSLGQDSLSASDREWLSQSHLEFGLPPASKTKPLDAGHVFLPSSMEMAEKLSDDDWIRLAPDAHGRSGASGRFDGELFDISQLLKDLAIKYPQRFLSLVLRFPAQTHAYLYDGVFRGVAEARKQQDKAGLTLDASELEQYVTAILFAGTLKNPEIAKSLCDLVKSISKYALPLEVLEVISLHATENPDPTIPDRRWKSELKGGEGLYAEDVLNAGMNCCRGYAVLTLGTLLEDDLARLAHVDSAVKTALKDESAAVVACAISPLFCLLKDHRDYAVSLFADAVRAAPDVLATQPVEEFLRFTGATHYAQLQAVLDLMLEDNDQDVVRAGARQVCLAGFSVSAAAPLVEKVCNGTEPMRKGAAEVYGINLEHPQIGRECEGRLIGFFSDPSIEVCREAGHAFRDFGESSLSRYQSIISQFIKSPAFVAEPESLLYSLRDASAPAPALVFAVAERVISAFAAEASDIQTRSSAYASIVGELVVDLYGTSKDPDIKTKCLDLIDQMERHHFYGIRETLRQRRT